MVKILPIQENKASDQSPMRNQRSSGGDHLEATPADSMPDDDLAKEIHRMMQINTEEQTPRTYRWVIFP